MHHDDTVSAYILDTQIKLFDDARHDLQLSIPEIARQSKLPVGTVNAWAQGRNAMSLWGVKHLLRVRGLAPLLSSFFEPEDYALTGVVRAIDHDSVADVAVEYLAEKQRFHHPESEAGRDLGPTETRALDSKVTALRAVAA